MKRSTCHMYISKPNSPEELYQFFITGIPLKPIGNPYRFDYRRKGWNVYTNFLSGNRRGIAMKFYSYNKDYRPDWKLTEYEYIETKDSQ